MILENIKIAYSAIASNKVRSFLTTLGIIIGVFSVTLMISLIQGLDKHISNQLTNLGPELISLSPGNIEEEGFMLGAPPGISDRLEQKDIDLIRKEIPEIKYLTEIRQTTGKTTYRGMEKKGMIIGVDPDFIKVFRHQIIAGKVFKRKEIKRVAVLGNGIAHEFFSTPDSAINQEIKIKGITFKVIGVIDESDFNIGSISINDAVFIPAKTSEKEFKTVIFEIDFLAPSVDDVPLIERKVERLIEKSHGKKDFSVFTADETMDFLKTVTGFISTVLGAITGISLLVGGIGIMNMMLTSVTERTREIGIRKAVGATNSQIAFQFLVEAVTLSVFGGILGLLLSFLGAKAITKYADFPTDISLNTLVLSLIFSIAVGIIFGTAPAMKAARKKPIDALRYE